MEKGVHRLIEASADAIVTMDLQKALEKAKTSGKNIISAKASTFQAPSL